MAALTLFPLQFQRQDSVPVDIDQVFSTTADRMTYLTSPRRHAGQVVVDLQLNEVFYLNAARDTWLSIESIQFQDEGINLGGNDATTLNFVGSGVTAARSGSVVTATIPGPSGSNGSASAEVVQWAQYPVAATVTDTSDSVLGTAVQSSYNSALSTSQVVPGLGAVSYSSSGRAAYKWQPYSPNKTILYTLSFNFNVVIPSAQTQEVTLVVFGKSANTASQTSNILFRKEFVILADANGVFQANETFDYLHLNSNIPLYLNLDLISL